jgi:uncharacterized phage-associated protein
MVPTFQAAKTLCELSGWRISNLPLQKLLYLSHMAFMGEQNGLPLIDGHFEAWDLGPVEPTLYRKVKAYGDKAIVDIFPHDLLEKSSKAYKIISEVYEQLKNAHPGQLVSITHWDEGAWASHYKPGYRGIVIPNEAILDEYRKREAAARQSAKRA